MHDNSRSQVLRSLPHRAPKQNPAKPSIEPRKTYMLCGGAGLAVVVVVATAVVAFNLGSQRPALAETNPGILDAAPVDNRPTQSKAPARKPSSNERFLEALGGLTAAHLYQSYLNIGLLADGVESEAYSDTEAQKMLAAVGSLMDLVDRQLDKVSANNLTPQDLESLEEIRGLSVLLRSQAQALRAYWTTGDREHAQRYHEVRERAWTTLSETLGLE